MYQKSAKAGSQSVLNGAGGDEELPRGEAEEKRGGRDSRDIQPDISNGRQPDKVGWAWAPGEAEWIEAGGDP